MAPSRDPRGDPRAAGRHRSDERGGRPAPSGAGPLEHAASSRSYASIVRANMLTLFNLILAVFGALTLLVRRLAGRAVPRRPGREHDDRDRPGDPREARARPPRALVAPTRDRRARRGGAPAAGEDVVVPATSSCSSPATSSSPTAASWRREGCAWTSRSSPASPSRVARAAGDELRSGAFVVGGHRRLHGRRRRHRQLRRARSRARRARSATRARRSSRRSTASCSSSSRRWCPSARCSATHCWHRDAAVREAVTTSTAARRDARARGPDPARQPRPSRSPRCGWRGTARWRSSSTRSSRSRPWT